MFLLLGAIAWVYIGRPDKLNQRAKYAIGYNTGQWNIGRSGIHYFFHFTVADSTYEGASLGPGDGMHMKKGFRFVVKYDSLSPGRNIGYFEYPIPDSIHQAPPTVGARRLFPSRSGFWTATRRVVSEDGGRQRGRWWGTHR